MELDNEGVAEVDCVTVRVSVDVSVLEREVERLGEEEVDFVVEIVKDGEEVKD